MHFYNLAQMSYANIPAPFDKSSIDLNRDFRIEITSAVVLNSFNLIISQLQFYKKSMLCFATTAMLNLLLLFLWQLGT
jgi:hypothetical protein